MLMTLSDPLNAGHLSQRERQVIFPEQQQARPIWTGLLLFVI